MKQADWAYAVEYGLSSEEINHLAEICNSENLSKFFIEGKYDNLSHYLKAVGGYSDDSNVLKCIEKFSESKKLQKSLSDNLEILGDGLTIIKIGSESIKRYFDIVALAKADELYSEMLQYLSKNCDFSSVRQASDEMYQVIHGEYISQLKYLLDPAWEEVEDYVYDKVLKKVAAAIPMGTIVYNSFKYSTGLANILFNTGDSQKQKANRRCVAYIGSCLSQWLQMNKNLYYQADEKDKNIYAKKTVFAYYMLLKTRMAGEESTRKYLELIHAPWKKEYTVSLQITSILKSMEELLKLEGVLECCENLAISCPVNVEVYDQSGNLVLTMYDGIESSGNVYGIHYDVMFHALDQDYVKIISLPENTGYNLKCVATDIGKVDLLVSSIENDGNAKRKETLAIPVSEGNEIEIIDISTKQPSCKLVDNEGGSKDFIVQPEKTEPVAITALSTDSETMELKLWDKELIHVEIIPNNATNQDIIWSSEDESIAKVNSDGVIEGVGIGKTKILASSAENENISIAIQLTVKCSEMVHNWDSGEVTKAPTCTEKGEKTYTCTVCGDTQTEDIDPTGHTSETDAAIEATCTTAGKTEGSHCSVCGEILEEQTEIPATGHTWDEGEVTKAPTCTEKGEKTYTCTVCEDTKTEDIDATGHNWNKDYTIDKEPTYTEEGQKSIHCSVCRQIKEGSIQTIPRKNDRPIIIVPPEPVRHAVTFIDRGKTIKIENVEFGTSAEAPDISRYGYNLSWDKDFSKVTGSMVVNAVWTVIIPDKVSDFAEKAEKTHIVLSWCKVEYADYYQIYRKTNTDKEYKAVAKTTNVSWTDCKIIVGTQYSYKVVAVHLVDGSKYQSKDSDIITVNFPAPKKGDIFTVGNLKYKVMSSKEVRVAGEAKAAKNVSIPSSVSIVGITFNVTGIDHKAFYRNKDIVNVKISNSVTYVGQYSFFQCPNLKTIKFGNRVKIISTCAFTQCPKLGNVTLPTSVERLGAKVFYHCGSINVLTIKATNLNYIGKKGLAVNSKTVVKVPKNKYAAYKKLITDSVTYKKLKIVKM